MPPSGCSALHGVSQNKKNKNQKKPEKTVNTSVVWIPLEHLLLYFLHFQYHWSLAFIHIKNLKNL